MRIGVVSDIHSNLEALSTVIGAMGAVDQLWCLGDIVGYGPEPNECVSVLAGTRHLAVAGNHDRAAIGQMDLEAFNPYAAAAARWTMGRLNVASSEYLSSLPTTLVSGEFTLMHGSPRDPLWEYVLSVDVARRSFDYFGGPFCLVGHTHVPSVFTLEGGRVRAERIVGDRELALGRPEARFILNPGSVGQPRDGEPRAAFLVVDTERRSASWQRVAYPIERTQERMRRIGLPKRLVERLAHGL